MGEEWSAERDLDVLVDSSLNMSQQCPGSRGTNRIPGAPKAAHPAAQKGRRPTASSAGAASPRVLRAVLGPAISEGCEGPRRRPEEANSAGGRAGRPGLRGAAEALGSSGLEQRGLRGDLAALCSFLGRGRGEGGADPFCPGSGDGHAGMVQSCARGGSGWTSGSTSSPRGWSDTATGFLGRWAMPQACQCFRGVWPMPLVTSFNPWSAPKRCQAAGLGDRCGPFQPKYSTTFYSVLFITY